MCKPGHCALRGKTPKARSADADCITRTLPSKSLKPKKHNRMGSIGNVSMPGPYTIFHHQQMQIVFGVYHRIYHFPKRGLYYINILLLTITNLFYRTLL